MLKSGDIIEKYLILEPLGAGHFGHVYKVLDRALDVEKAIKVLNVNDPTQFLQTLQEAQILHKCKHKHIVEVNEANIFHVEGAPKVIIDMEYLPHGSLEHSMKTKFITVPDAMKLISGVLYGLQHAHCQGILHRDIKPANIMLDTVFAKLSDFGLATDVGGSMLGSPRGYITHLAPEVFAHGQTTFVTDIFAVGVTFYRVVNNLNDWKSVLPCNKDQLLKQGKLLKTIGYQDYIPTQIKTIVNKACHIDPTRRYQSALEMCQAIEKLKPSINWNMINDTNWEGLCCNSGDCFQITATGSRVHKVELKKNNRTLHSECVLLPDISACQNYITSYVSKTILAG